MINNLKKEKKMSKVKVKEEKGGNPVLTTFGGLLIGLGISDCLGQGLILQLF